MTKNIFDKNVFFGIGTDQMALFDTMALTKWHFNTIALTKWHI